MGFLVEKLFETVILDLEEQALIYTAFMELINETYWISGVVSDDFFPPMGLVDFSSSVHGKPAEEILSAWYYAFLQNSH